MLSKAQKFYVDQNRSKMSLEQLAIDLETGVDQIESYLKEEINRIQSAGEEKKKSVGISIMTPQLSELYDVVSKPKNNTAHEHITTTKRPAD